MSPKPAPEPSEFSHAQLTALADQAVMQALGMYKFNENRWNFDPLHVRRLLQVLTSIFSALSLYSVLWARMSYHWMFISFDTVLGALLYYWYYKVECGGGRLIFSPDWRDSFVVTRATPTNYVIDINVGYTDRLTVSIPFNAFKLRAGPRVSKKWMAREIGDQLRL